MSEKKNSRTTTRELFCFFLLFCFFSCLRLLIHFVHSLTRSRAHALTRARPSGRPKKGPALTPADVEVERHVIEEALEKSGGNRTAAARALGVTFRSLRYRLERLGIKE